MYKQIINDAVNVGYNGLSFYRYDRDDFYYASNIIAMSDDYLKFKTGYKKQKEEYYLGIKKTKSDNINITSDKEGNELLLELLNSIEEHTLFNDNVESNNSTLLNDIQAIYYIIGHIYEKALTIIGEKNPCYKVINRQPLSSCLIEKEMIDNLSDDEKHRLIVMILDLFTTHTELSRHFDETIKKISIICNFDEKNLDNFSISDFMEKITQLKKDIESTQTDEIFKQKNEIIEIKNTLNALRFIKNNDIEQYNKYEKYDIELRNQLKEELRQTYIFFYKNRNVFKFEDVLSYFKDILQDPQSLSSEKDESKSLCEEIYEEIISDLNNGNIKEIDDSDEFKIYSMRISASSFGFFELLYTYEHDIPTCRLEVYSEMMSRIFGKDEKRLIIKTIEQIIKTQKYSTFDSVVCFDDNIRTYIDSINLNEETIVQLIYEMYKINSLEILIQSLPNDYLEFFEEKILMLMNEGEVNSSEIFAREIYKQLVKK